MRQVIAVAVICLGASLVFAATGNLKPLNVKTGLWEMTETSTVTGLPPQFAAALAVNGVPIHYKSCVKQSDLLKNPWSNGSNRKCSWTVLSSNGTDMKVQGTCALANSRMSAQMRMHGTIHAVDSEHGKGAVDFTWSGNGMNAKGHADYTGKWIGATCPADMQ
jgi:hypothetical protein